MTVLDLSPPPGLSGPATATVGHTRSLAFTGVTAISLSDSAATGSTIDTVALSVHNGTLGVSLSDGATIIAGANGRVSLTLGGTLTQLNAVLASLVYTAPTTGTSDTLTAVATDGIASSTPLATTITLTNIASAIATPGLYNPTSSWWYLRNSNATGAANIMAGYGAPGGNWIPLSGDWTGNGTDTLGLYNPATGFFYLRNSNTTGVGNISWTGAGHDSIGMYDPATSTWYLRNELSTGVADLTFVFGSPGSDWLPVVGDWSGATSVQAPAALISPADEESTQLASTWPLQTVDPRAVDQLAGSDDLWSVVAILAVAIL